MSQVSIRRAQLSDYSAVVEGIGDVYWGRDYLPSMFQRFVEDPDFLSFVAEVDGEVVGFYSGELLDGRQTLDKRAGRVKDVHQGQGIFTQLSDVIEAEVSRLGSVRWEVMACVKATAERVSKGFTGDKGFKQIVHMQVYHAKMVKAEIEAVNPSTFANVQEMTQSNMEELFGDETTWKKIIRQGRMSVHNVPMRRCKENIRRFQNLKAEAFMSFGSSGLKNSSVSEEKDVSKATMISTINYFPVSIGLAFNSDLYGSDYTDLESHLQLHVHRFLELAQEKGNWCLNVDFGIYPEIEDRLRDCLALYGLPLKQNPNVIEELLFERPFSPSE